MSVQISIPSCTPISFARVSAYGVTGQLRKISRYTGLWETLGMVDASPVLKTSHPTKPLSVTTIRLTGIILILPVLIAPL